MILKAHERGRLAEDKALSYLTRQGLTLLERNYRSRLGEIDLIMRDRDITVFLEVRARTNTTVIETMETIDTKKQQRIILASQHYLQNNRPSSQDIYRFDVILLTGILQAPRIEWIKNAFEA